MCAFIPYCWGIISPIKIQILAFGAGFQKYIEKSPKLEELSSSGMWKTLRHYSYFVERLEEERKKEEQQRQREIEQE